MLMLEESWFEQLSKTGLIVASLLKISMELLHQPFLLFELLWELEPLLV